MLSSSLNLDSVWSHQLFWKTETAKSCIHFCGTFYNSLSGQGELLLVSEYLTYSRKLIHKVPFPCISVCVVESWWKLLGFSGFKLSSPTINDFCCQSGSKVSSYFFFLEITFPAWSCWLRKCCHYTQVLSTNFINVTILLKLVLASAFQELSKWHSTIGNYCISPWKDLLKQHENLEVFNRESNTENRTFTFLKMSQWL